MKTGAFAHTEEAERARGRQKIGIEALAIITDAQGEPAAFGFDGYRQSGGIGVANDVGEDFLKDAEEGEGWRGGESGAAGESAPAATNTGARFEFLELPVEGRGTPDGSSVRLKAPGLT